jgi:hypothetical protein
MASWSADSEFFTPDKTLLAVKVYLSCTHQSPTVCEIIISNNIPLLMADKLEHHHIGRQSQHQHESKADYTIPCRS